MKKITDKERLDWVLAKDCPDMYWSPDGTVTVETRNGLKINRVRPRAAIDAAILSERKAKKK